ncbi:hypothetical protein FACS189463_2960 [Bacteroidia bacterium]|nr:hypothetical protein FACS189463_2960 [Bacteroidia bacterium]
MNSNRHITYHHKDIVESLKLISELEEGLRKRDERLRKNLDKTTYLLYKALKKDLKKKYGRDPVLRSLITKIPAIFLLQEYIIPAIGVAVCLVWYLLIYRLGMYFSDFVIFLHEWGLLAFVGLTQYIVCAILMMVVILKLINTTERLSLSIYKIQKVLEEYRKHNK